MSSAAAGNVAAGRSMNSAAASISASGEARKPGVRFLPQRDPVPLRRSEEMPPVPETHPEKRLFGAEMTIFSEGSKLK